MNTLIEKKCKACSHKTPKLLDKEIGYYLKEIKGWSLNENKEMIFKKFTFKTFKKALMVIYMYSM